MKIKKKNREIIGDFKIALFLSGIGSETRSAFSISYMLAAEHVAGTYPVAFNKMPKLKFLFVVNMLLKVKEEHRRKRDKTN